jgi:hypothetical protein
VILDFRALKVLEVSSQMAQRCLNYKNQGHRNHLKSEDVSKTRKAPARAAAFTKKLIAPSCNIGFKISNT